MSVGGGYNGGKTRMGTKVVLNLYDLSPVNDCLYPIGIGLHHSGVEILGSEYAYGSGGGIFDATPKEVESGAVFRESISLGTFEGGSSQLRGVIDELRNEFRPDGYNIITKNCNHFANALVWSLLGRQIPPYINRMAYIGNMISCLLPKKLLQSAPVDGDGSGAYGGGYHAPGFQAYGGSSSNAAMTSRFKGSAGKKLGSIDGSGGSDGGMGGGIQKLLGTMSIGGSSDRGKDDLTDRRERVRKAALARLERQSKDSGDG